MSSAIFFLVSTCGAYYNLEARSFHICRGLGHEARCSWNLCSFTVLPRRPAAFYIFEGQAKGFHRSNEWYLGHVLQQGVWYSLYWRCKHHCCSLWYWTCGYNRCAKIVDTLNAPVPSDIMHNNVSLRNKKLNSDNPFLDFLAKLSINWTSCKTQVWLQAWWGVYWGANRSCWSLTSSTPPQRAIITYVCPSHFNVGLVNSRSVLSTKMWWCSATIAPSTTLHVVTICVIGKAEWLLDKQYRCDCDQAADGLQCMIATCCFYVLCKSCIFNAEHKDCPWDGPESSRWLFKCVWVHDTQKSIPHLRIIYRKVFLNPHCLGAPWQRLAYIAPPMSGLPLMGSNIYKSSQRSYHQTFGPPFCSDGDVQLHLEFFLSIVTVVLTSIIVCTWNGRTPFFGSQTAKCIAWQTARRHLPLVISLAKAYSHWAELNQVYWPSESSPLLSSESNHRKITYWKLAGWYMIRTMSKLWKRAMRRNNKVAGRAKDCNFRQQQVEKLWEWRAGAKKG